MNFKYTCIALLVTFMHVQAYPLDETGRVTVAPCLCLIADVSFTIVSMNSLLKREDVMGDGILRTTAQEYNADIMEEKAKKA